MRRAGCTASARSGGLAHASWAATTSTVASQSSGASYVGIGFAKPFDAALGEEQSKDSKSGGSNGCGWHQRRQLDHVLLIGHGGGKCDAAQRSAPPWPVRSTSLRSLSWSPNPQEQSTDPKKSWGCLSISKKMATQPDAAPGNAAVVTRPRILPMDIGSHLGSQDLDMEDDKTQGPFSIHLSNVAPHLEGMDLIGTI